MVGNASIETMSPKEQKEKQREYSDGGFPKLLDFIYHHFEEFKLLVHCSPGTLYYDFLESIVEIDMRCTGTFLQRSLWERK